MAFSKMNVELEIETARWFRIPVLILGVFCVLPNTLLLHVLKKLERLGTISYKLIIVLSISDTCIGIIGITSFTVVTFFPDEFNLPTIICLYSMMYFGVLFSFCMIIIISIDRYFHMKYLMRYSTIMTSRRAIIMVAIAASMSVFFDALVVSGRVFGFAFPVQLALNISLVIGILALFIIYMKTFRTIQSRMKDVKLGK